MIRRAVLAVIVILAAGASYGQVAALSQSSPAPLAATAPTSVPALIPYSGVAEVVPGERIDNVVSVTFLLFKEEHGGEPLWSESQVLPIKADGRFTAQLGASTASGLPPSAFASGKARWLEVQVAGQKPQPRVLLMSVPYSMKAADAATLGGLPASAFALAGSTSHSYTPSSTPSGTGLGPDASSTVTTTGGTSGYLPAFTASSIIGNSTVYESGGKVGIGTTSPAGNLDVNGSIVGRGALALVDAATATSSKGSNSQPIDLVTSVWNSSTSKATTPYFQLQAEPVGNNTSTPSASFNFLYDNGSTLAETGLSISSAGILHFAPGQTFPITGSGTITGVKAGTGLTGGGTSGSVTLNLDTTKIPQLAVSNNFTGTQTITNGILNLSPTTGSQLGAIYIGGVPFLHGYSGGHKNVFVGGAGNFSTTGSFNAAVGYQALFSQSSGYGNTAVGDVALYANTTGYNNTALGNSALFSNTAGTFNTAVGASSGPALGSLGLTNTTAIGAGATVSQSNSLVLGQTTASKPGTTFVNAGVGTSAPRSIFEIAQAVTGGLGPVFSLTNPAGQSGAAAAIDFNTSTPVNGSEYIPNAEIRAIDAGGYTDNLLFFSNQQGAINKGYQLNMEIGANGQVGIGTSVPADEAQLVVSQNENNIGAIQAYAQTIQSGAYAGYGGNAIKGRGGDSTGNGWAGAGAEFTGGSNFENGQAGDGIDAAAGIGGSRYGYGGYFSGDVFVYGTIQSSNDFSSPINPAIAGTTIDHPLDPANKYLTLASVESPELTSVISGNVTTDELGVAVVKLPAWFDAMHTDFRYQLTVVGGRFAQAIVSKEIDNHQFSISTNATHVKVSWQVTAVRQDAYAKAHPLIVEEQKDANEQGFYKHPELYGLPEEKQVAWAHHGASLKRMKERRLAEQAEFAKGAHHGKPNVHGITALAAPAAPNLP